MARAQKIAVTVVVSGARLSVTENTRQKVAHLIREALKEAGIPQPRTGDWTLRFADGGAAIDPDLHIDEAGIADGAVLFLDPDEGGGGEAVVASGPDQAEPPPAPLLVDPAVSVAKLERQLVDWEDNADTYRERGWQLLGREGLEVDIAFTARLPIGPGSDLVVFPLAVRLDFHNFDLWPPSLRVIDPLSRRWLQAPRVRAIDFDAAEDAGAPLDLFVDRHPDTNRVFLCTPGTREYHTHFEHSGDDWLLYRDQGFGTIARLCGLLWRTAVCTIGGLNLGVKRPPFGDWASGAGSSFSTEIRQERAPEAPGQPGQPIPIQKLPPQLLAQLPPELQALASDRQ